MKNKISVDRFTPKNDQVIVKIIKERSMTTSGIVLPDSGGFAEQGGESDYYKVEIIKYSKESLAINPGIGTHKYGLVSIFSGHYLMTTKGTYKSVPSFTIVAVTDDVEFSADSILPTCNRVLVIEVKESDQTEAGIFMGESASDPRTKDTLVGEIIKVGPLSKENLNIGDMAIYDPYVGNMLPRLSKVKEIDVTRYIRNLDSINEQVPIEKKEKVKYKVVHEHDITLTYK